jgi:thiol-disulfide isomerase/thioredoxin
VRELTDELTHRRTRLEGGEEYSSFLAPPGSLAPDFTTTSVDGARRSRGDLIGRPSVIAFLSASCVPCHKQVPDLVRYAPTVASSANVLAVISGSGDKVDALMNELKEVATVVIGEDAHSLGSAFSVQAYPTFYLLDESGVIQSGGPTVQRLAAGAATFPGGELSVAAVL